MISFFEFIKKKFKWILMILSTVGITAGFGPAIYNSIDGHIKGQDTLIQNISEQYKQNQLKISDCFNQQEIYLANSKQHTENSQEMLLILKAIKNNESVTQKAQDRLSKIIEENSGIQKLNSNEKAQEIILCQKDVMNNYRQIMIELEMIKANDLSVLSNGNISQDNSLEELKKLSNINLQEVVNGYFNSSNKSHKLIYSLEKMINLKNREEQALGQNVTELEKLVQQLEIKIEGEISNRKNDNIFEKWLRAIF